MIVYLGTLLLRPTCTARAVRTRTWAWARALTMTRSSVIGDAGPHYILEASVTQASASDQSSLCVGHHVGRTFPTVARW